MLISWVGEAESALDLATCESRVTWTRANPDSLAVLKPD